VVRMIDPRVMAARERSRPCGDLVGEARGPPVELKILQHENVRYLCCRHEADAISFSVAFGYYD
jgi:hypothetical protein